MDKVILHTQSQNPRVAHFSLALANGKPHCSIVKRKVNPAWRDAPYDIYFLLPDSVMLMKRINRRHRKRKTK